MWKEKSKPKNILKLGALNCEGIKEKIDYPEFHHLLHERDLFGVCETWLNEDDTRNIEIEGYKFYPLNRKKENRASRGGVGFFIKNDLKKHIKIRYDLSSEYVLWCKLSRYHFGYPEDVYVGIVYIPPETSTREKRLNTDHFKELKETISKIDSEHIILLGDFNARSLTLDDTLLAEKHDNFVPPNFYSNIKTERSNQDLIGNKYGKMLVEYCIASRSYIANGRTLGDLQGKVTCHQNRGSSTVDYAIITENLNSFVRRFQVLDPSTGSDHSPISLEMHLPQTNVNNIKTNNREERIAPQCKWNDITRRMFLSKIQSEESNKTVHCIETLLDQGDIDVAVEKLGNLMNISPMHHLKRKQPRKQRTKKWYDYTCHEMGKRLKLVAKLCAASPTNPHLRGSLTKTRREYKKLLKIKKNEWKSQMIQQLENMETKDPKAYWNMVNELREKKQSKSSFDTEEFTTFFEKLYAKSKHNNKEIEEYIDLILGEHPLENSTPDFTLEELKKAINRLKNNKAAGPDRIPGEILKACPPKILTLILKIINKVKHCYKYPKNWGLGITSLIFKDGDDENPNNYRAITVTDALSKVLALMINERLEGWCDENDILKIEQIGFKKQTRPGDHLFVLKTLIDTYTNKNKKLYACFVDFKKAFDSVWRAGLIYKLIKYGMDLQYVNLIKCMYSETQQALKINNLMTRPFKTHRGVRQGCILSPRLFNLFINDIPDLFDGTCSPVQLNNTKINCLMYADDLVILSETSTGLQNCLDKLHNYTLKWDLQLNIKKTKVMIFQNSGKGENTQFNFGPTRVLEKCKSYKYLGTIMTNTGNFKQNTTNLKKKGLRAAFIISKNIGKYSKPSTSIAIFEKVVEPILMYNCEIAMAYIPKTWNFYKFREKMWEVGQELDTVTMGFIRQLLGVHKKTTNIAIKAETGKYPMSLKIYSQIFKYWIRLTTSTNRLLKGALTLNIENNRIGKQSWMRIVEFLLQAVNMQNTNPHENTTKNIKTFCQNLKQDFDRWWKSQAKVTGENKLDFYYSFKKTFEYEKYLDNVPRQNRIPITRLRLSSHCLPIEILRYKKDKNGMKYPREKRLCSICRLQEVGDETHYLLKCNNGRMQETRDNFMSKIKQKLPQMETFMDKNIIEYCINMKDENIQIPMAQYVKTILKIYKEERDEPNPPDIKQNIVTRAGRLVKKPVKLDL